MYSSNLHTVRVESLGALRTLDVDPSLLQLDFYVDLEAVYARQMGAVSKKRKMFHRRGMKTERALPNLRKSFRNYNLSVRTENTNLTNYFQIALHILTWISSFLPLSHRAP